MALVSTNVYRQKESLTIRLCGMMDSSVTECKVFTFSFSRKLMLGRVNTILKYVFALMKENGNVNVGECKALKKALKDSRYLDPQNDLKTEEIHSSGRLRKHTQSGFPWDVGSSDIGSHGSTSTGSVMEEIPTDAEKKHNHQSEAKKTHSDLTEAGKKRNHHSEEKKKHNHHSEAKKKHNHHSEAKKKQNHHSEVKKKHNHHSEAEKKHNHHKHNQMTETEKKHHHQSEENKTHSDLTEAKKKHNHHSEAKKKHNHHSEAKKKHNYHSEVKKKHNHHSEAEKKHNGLTMSRKKHTHQTEAKKNHSHLEETKETHNHLIEDQKNNKDHCEAKKKHKHRTDAETKHNHHEHKQMTETEKKHNHQSDENKTHSDLTEAGKKHNHQIEDQKNDKHHSEARKKHKNHSEAEKIHSHQTETKVKHSRQTETEKKHNHHSEPENKHSHKNEAKKKHSHHIMQEQSEMSGQDANIMKKDRIHPNPDFNEDAESRLAKITVESMDKSILKSDDLLKEDTVVVGKTDVGGNDSSRETPSAQLNQVMLAPVGSASKQRQHSCLKDRIVTIKELSSISSLIGNGWEFLGRALEISDTKLEHIKEDYQDTRERIYQMLKTWKELSPSEATISTLMAAIQESYIALDTDKIENIFDGTLASIGSISGPETYTPCKEPARTMTSNSCQPAMSDVKVERLQNSIHDNSAADDKVIQTTRPLFCPYDNLSGNMKAQTDETDAVWKEKLRVKLAKSVGIINSPYGSFGTGFRVGPDCIMTARHVIEYVLNAVPSLNINHLSNAYIDFSYEVQGAPVADNRRFFFKPEIVYENTDMDTAILRLQPSTQTYPPPLTFAELPVACGQLYFIGHPGCDIKKRDKVDCVKLIKDDKIAAEEWSFKHVGVNGYKNIDNPHRLLFHCTFGKGASGSPGVSIYLENFQPCAKVVTMLLCGYPSWYYDSSCPQKKKDETPKEYCVEQGLCIRSVSEDMRVIKPDLWKEIFYETSNDDDDVEMK